MEGLDPISRWAHTVYWEPWIALGAVGAVVWAIWLANLSGRAARERDAATIRSLMVIAHGLIPLLRGRAAREVSGDLTGTELDSFEGVRVLVENIRVTDMPTWHSANAFMTIAAKVRLLDSLGKISARRQAGAVMAKHCSEAARELEHMLGQLSREIVWVRSPMRSWIRWKARQLRDWKRARFGRKGHPRAPVADA